ncbi:MAG: DUF3025 domain-containing protein, partial [Burkholderiales bacterium]
MLEPLVACAAELCCCREWPQREMLQELMDARGVTNERGDSIRLVAESSRLESYEVRVYRRGELQVRERDWHDLFNVLAWLAYPRSKAALNARHFSALLQESGDAGRPEQTRGRPNRSRVRDALTLFDESGAIVVSSDPQLIADLRAFRWKKLFWGARGHVASAMRFYVFGHGILEKALSPYVGMTAHAVPLVTGAEFMETPFEQQIARIDQLVAACVTEIDGMTTPRLLAPLPLLGVPGWWTGNQDESFYDNAFYFRSGRRSRPGKGVFSGGIGLPRRCMPHSAP